MKSTRHRRRSSVNFGSKHFCPKIYVLKINKMPEFYIIFYRKNIFPIVWWGTVLPAPRLLRLWYSVFYLKRDGGMNSFAD